MTAKYAWYQVPGTCEYSEEHSKVRFYCFLVCLAIILVPGTRYENDFFFFFVFVLCFLQVNLYLYIPLRTLNYSTHTAVRYRVVRFCNHSVACVN